MKKYKERQLSEPTRKVLEILEIEAEAFADMFWVMMGGKTGYYKRANWLASGRDKESFPGQDDWGFLEPWKEKVKEYNKYASLLYRLEQQGLVEKNPKNKKLWILSKKGKLRLAAEKEAEVAREKLFEGNGLTIVSYDIPEKLRRDRDWLRELLVGLGFGQVQKSVWFAPKKISVAFLKHLKERKITQYVQIFEVSKTGSLQARDLTKA